MDVVGVSVIAGRTVAGEGPPFHAAAAATGEPVDPPFATATANLVAEACTAAAAAFPAYRARPLGDRAAFLTAIAEEIEAIGEALTDRVQLETGLPEARVLGERGRTAAQARLFADVVRRGDFLGLRLDAALPDRLPLPKPDLRLRRVPIGPVAVWGASNFPLAFSTAGGDTISALAAGCPVVVKGHPAHPGTAELVARAVARAAARTGMPAGVFSLLQDGDVSAARALAVDPRIAAIAFTGSRSGGLALAALAAARSVPIPVFAELSAVNPVIVLPGAMESAEDRSRLAEGYLTSLTFGAGQLCTNPGLLFVPVGEAGDALVAEIGGRVRATAGATMLHPGISSAYAGGVARRAGVVGVAEVGIGAGTCLAPASAVHECSLATFAEQPHLAEEVFGAAGLVVRYCDAGSLAAALAGLEGQLTATLHGSDAPADLAAAAALLPVVEERAGRLIWNGWPTGVEVTHAMVHGGPFPATTAPWTTSVGTLAIERFLRPVAYQNLPQSLLPEELRDGNPWGVARMLDGQPS